MSEIPSESRRSAADQTELEKLLRSSKPWFEENATTLIYALAAVLAVAAIVVYMNRTPAGDVAASGDLLVAVSPEDFGDVADTYPDTSIGIWSRLRQADRLLDDAVTNMFKDRKRGLEDLDRAEAAYEQLATKTDLPDEIRERLLIGMARLAETRCNGSQETTDAAVAAWQRVLDEFENTLVKEHAEARIEKLPSEESRAFYKWFSEQNPKPALSGDTSSRPSVPEVPDTSSKTDSKTSDEGDGENDASTSGEAEPEKETTEKAASEKTESSESPKSDSEADGSSKEAPKPEPKKPETSDPAASDKAAEPEQPKEKEADGEPDTSEETPETDNKKSDGGDGDK